MLIRRHGRIVFADLKDQTATVQLVFLDDPRVRDLDRGDWIGVGPASAPTRASRRSGSAHGAC